MGKGILTLATALCLVFTFAFGASAHTEQASRTNQHAQLYTSVHPNADTGGCSSSTTNGSGNISAK